MIFWRNIVNILLLLWYIYIYIVNIFYACDQMFTDLKISSIDGDKFCYKLLSNLIHYILNHIMNAPDVINMLRCIHELIYEKNKLSVYGLESLWYLLFVIIRLNQLSHIRILFLPKSCVPFGYPILPLLINPWK